MKQFFYKSGLMTAVLIMASMVFVLSAVAYFNQKNLYKPLEQMTDDYAVAYGETESLANLCKGWQKDGEMDFKVRGMKLTDGCALQWGSDPEFPLTEGRLFDAGDYEKGTDTALIREDIEALCEKRDGKLYITIGDEEYEVIGKYREKNSTDDRNSRYIVNLYVKNLPVTEGQYLFYDGGADSLSRLQSAGEKRGSKLSCKRASEASEIINKNILAEASGILTNLCTDEYFLRNLCMASRQKKRDRAAENGRCCQRADLWLAFERLLFILYREFCGVGYPCVGNHLGQQSL